MEVYCRKDDNTFHSRDGVFRHFGLDEFVQRIISEHHCFVCGLPLNEISREHILPDWLLRRENLHSKKITLPNGARTNYGSYVVPCCPPCNASLNEIYEKPISKAFKGGFDSLSKFYESQPLKLFCWLALIYFKTHLKDLYFRQIVSDSITDDKIASVYHWPDFHHLHAILRAPLVGNKIDESVIGSMVLMEVSLPEKEESFDYRDHLITQSILLRTQDIGICAIFDDCCHVLSMIENIVGVPKFIGPPQCLQILTEMQTAAIHLRNRPIFRTEFNTLSGDFTIRPEIPERPDVMDFDANIRGILMEYNFNQHLPRDEDKLLQIRAGVATTIQWLDDE